MNKNTQPELGKLVEGVGLRDAIHIAVVGVMAVERLLPGQHVGVVEDGFGDCNVPIGIVDPFLKEPVRKGQRFWLLLYPNTITSLRHEWTHPTFADQPVAPATEPPTPVVTMSKEEATSKIRDFASKIHQEYEDLMAVAGKWCANEGRPYTYDNSEGYKLVDYDDWKMFWKCYEVVTGGQKPNNEDDIPFTCSC